MLANYLGQFTQTYAGLSALLLVLNAILHVIYAGGVAKDVGDLHRRDLPARFIPGFAWVLAVLIGGILVLVAYWLIHHSSLSRGK